VVQTKERPRKNQQNNSAYERDIVGTDLAYSHSEGIDPPDKRELYR
jgi:hypothetical protein